MKTIWLIENNLGFAGRFQYLWKRLGNGYWEQVARRDEVHESWVPCVKSTIRGNPEKYFKHLTFTEVSVDELFIDFI